MPFVIEYDLIDFAKAYNDQYYKTILFLIKEGTIYVVKILQTVQSDHLSSSLYKLIIIKS